MAPTTSHLLVRMRAGAGLTTRDAAERLGVTNAAITQWEGGSLDPRRLERRLWEAARAWAQGKPTQGEENPSFLVSYPFLGSRYFLVDRKRAIYVFTYPEHAGDCAVGLEKLGLEEVVVVPAWRSALRKLERNGAAIHVYEDGPGNDPVEPFRTYLGQLAEEYIAKFGAGAGPP